MATTGVEAAFAGAVEAICCGRLDVPGATVNTAALAIAGQIDTALASPVLTAAKQGLLRGIVAGTLQGRYLTGVIPAALVSKIAAIYTATTGSI